MQANAGDEFTPYDKAERFLREQRVAFESPQDVRDWLAISGEAGIPLACERIRQHAATPAVSAFVEALGVLVSNQIYRAAGVRLTGRRPKAKALCRRFDYVLGKLRSR